MSKHEPTGAANGGRPGSLPQLTFPRNQVRPVTTEQPPRRPFEPIQYQEEERNNIQGLLNKVLGPEYVSSRPGGGGTKVSYIEGWRALNLANEVFGFNGWNSELISTQVDYFDTHGATGRFSMGLSVVVRVTIKDGTYHEDFGYGFIDNAKSKAMAFEKCKKEAFTDGIKRCLRCFGNVLGNCLYDRTIMAKIQKVQLPKPELNDDNFHRDPLVRESERVKLLTTRMVVHESKANQNTVANQSTPIPQKVITPPVVNGMLNITVAKSTHIPTSDQTSVSNTVEKPHSQAREFDEMDDSFLFSDEEDKDEIEDKTVVETPATKHITSNENEIPAVLPMFVSAKGAEKIQNAQHSTTDIPQFDLKFVSPSIRRTLDPHKSAPVKRVEAKAPKTDFASPRPITQLHPNASFNDTNNHGKRIGMPPSSQSLKRSRPESLKNQDSTIT